MAKIVIHRLEDWAVGRAILPALHAAGVPVAVLKDCVFYFAAKGTPNPFKALEDGPGIKDVQAPLLAVGRALARFGSARMGFGSSDDHMTGFHGPSEEATLQTAATHDRKNEVVRVCGSAAADVDTAVAAITSRRAEGRSEAEIIEAMAADEVPGKDDGTLDFACISFFDRLDQLPEPALRTLLKLAGNLPADLQSVAQRVCDVFVTAERINAFELATLTAIRSLASQTLRKRCEEVYRDRVLADDSASLAQLMQVFDDLDGEIAKHKRLAPRFRALWEAALARDDYPLEGLVYALNRSAIDRETFERHVLPAFRRAVSTGFRNADGFGDESSFEEAIELVAKKDPDLALEAFTMLSACFNEYGLRSLLDHARALPKRGYSAAALKNAGSHFSQPQRRSAAKIFAKVLKTWGVEVTAARPPALGTIDHTFEVGTDVATLVIGSFAAVEKISNTEELDDCTAAVRRTKSLGFMTGGDGWYSVRVVGAASAEAAADHPTTGTQLGVAPLRIDDDTLTVSGVVGGGGAPTIPFPSGNYAARILGHEQGELSVTVLVYPVDTLPKWPFGSALPDFL